MLLPFDAETNYPYTVSINVTSNSNGNIRVNVCIILRLYIVSLNFTLREYFKSCWFLVFVFMLIGYSIFRMCNTLIIGHALFLTVFFCLLII